MKILNFGSCNIDYVYSMEHIVQVGETQTAYRMETFPGGKGLNQSVALAKSGAEVYHAGCIGHDGGLLAEVLEESGADIRYLKTVEEKTGHAIIQVSEVGENAIFIYAGANESISKEYIDSVLAHFEKDDILLLQNEVGNVAYMVERARAKQMCIVFNPSPINEKINEIDFGKLDYLLLNEVEVAAISGVESPQKGFSVLKERYPCLKILLTLGDKGCLYWDGEKTYQQAAYCVQTVDTTAAGDTFTGYFVGTLSRGEDCAYSLKVAAAAAALAVSRKGAAPSIPSIHEVEAAAEELPNYPTGNKSEELRQKIHAYINGCLQTANLKELAEELGYSPAYTGNVVKKLTGESFVKLVMTQRCRAAANLLATSDLSVEEIVRRVGYENESFFRKAFYERFGKTLLAYRKEVQNR